MSVRIANKLPEGDRDGLQVAERDLRQLRDPILVVAELYPRSVADVLDKPSDPYLVTLGVRAIEVLQADDAMAAHALMSGVFERRTGKIPIPFGMVLDAGDDLDGEP